MKSTHFITIVVMVMVSISPVSGQTNTIPDSSLVTGSSRVEFSRGSYYFIRISVEGDRPEETRNEFNLDFDIDFLLAPGEKLVLELISVQQFPLSSSGWDLQTENYEQEEARLFEDYDIEDYNSREEGIEGAEDPMNFTYALTPQRGDVAKEDGFSFNFDFSTTSTMEKLNFSVSYGLVLSNSTKMMKSVGSYNVSNIEYSMKVEDAFLNGVLSYPEVFVSLITFATLILSRRYRLFVR